MTNTLRFNKLIIGPMLFIIFSISMLYFTLSNTPRVLILHSYHVDYVWTKLLDRSLTIALNARPHIRHKYFYMNSKHTYNQATELSVNRMIEQYDPDIILAFDDNAQHFLSKFYLNSDKKIVFSGVNGDVKKYGFEGKKNIGGVFERKLVQGITFVLSSLNRYHNTPDKHNIVLLTNYSNSSDRDITYLHKQEWDDFNFSSRKVRTFKEWQRFVLDLPEQKIDYLLVSSYRNLLVRKSVKGVDDEYVNFQTVVDWTLEHARIPILGLNVFSAKDGFPIAVGSSPYEQVEQAINIVDAAIFNNLEIDNVYKYPDFYSISINRTALNKLNYSIPIILKSFAASSQNIYD